MNQLFARSLFPRSPVVPADPFCAEFGDDVVQVLLAGGVTRVDDDRILIDRILETGRVLGEDRIDNIVTRQVRPVRPIGPYPLAL